MTITNLAPDNWQTTTPPAQPQHNYTLPWLDSTEPQAVGEGLTRTSSGAARLFHMLLEFTNARPMRCTVRALNWRQAEAFARNRHPNLAALTRLPQAGQKP
jgi:hypothetical protein